MVDRPISFSPPMVRALLDGRKTQTRRVLKPQPDFRGGCGEQNDAEAWGWEDEDGYHVSVSEIAPNRYAPGDRLYVREAWRSCVSLDHQNGRQIGERASEAGYTAAWGPVFYEADGAVAMWPDCAFTDTVGRYRHARFMPRWASRLTLRVTDVRVQRLWQITNNEAIAEGIKPQHQQSAKHGGAVLGWGYDGLDGYGPGTPKAALALLWDSLHGPGAWARNDWVAAISFDVIRANIDAKGDNNG
jgi:hypothetical protein